MKKQNIKILVEIVSLIIVPCILLHFLPGNPGMIALPFIRIAIFSFVRGVFYNNQIRRIFYPIIICLVVSIAAKIPYDIRIYYFLQDTLLFSYLGFILGIILWSIYNFLFKKKKLI